VSSAIASFDFSARTGVTASGRKYMLIGESGRDDDTDYVWMLWALYNAVETAEDVSGEYEARGIGEH